MLGFPKCKKDDIVEFHFENDVKTGIVEIVDANGTIDNDTDVSYDIYVKSENTLYKHIAEAMIRNISG